MQMSGESLVSGGELSLRDIATRNPVYLISADLPGCGASTLSKGMADRLHEEGFGDAHVLSIGNALRAQLGVTNEVEMAQKLKEINDPHSFDPIFYGDLPEDRPCIIEGKLATTVGPRYIDTADRPIVRIDLTSRPLVSAKRVTQRESSMNISEIFYSEQGGQVLLGKLALIETRAAHDMNMRSVMQDGHTDEVNGTTVDLKFDTSALASEEIIEKLFDEADFSKHVPEWELRSLRETMATLAGLQVMLDGAVSPNDTTHFVHQYEGIRYNVERLSVQLSEEGIADVRSTLKKSIVDCWFGLMMKQSPRFFADAEGERTVDYESFNWTPEYYKIAEGWPVLGSILKDKVILDPFGGAGTLVNLLAARDIPAKAFLSDIAYEGGKPLTDKEYTYLPSLNKQASQLLFDNLPSWYRPNLQQIAGYVTADATKLPFATDSIDYIVSDPPYGKNCENGGLGLLIGSLREFGRVAREGSVLMVPVEWVKEIEAAGNSVQQLTTDVSRGHSKLPVCYILINATSTKA